MNKAIHEAPLAVVCTPLAKVDRRALSQAWYSALHLQTKDEARSRQALQAANPSELRPYSRAHADRAAEGLARMTATSRKSTTRSQPRQTPAFERRKPPSEVARKIERLLRSSHDGSRSGTLALEGDHGRVHIVIRLQGSHVRIIAVCAPQARELVRAALAEARYALAGTGVSLVATLQSEAS